MLNPFAVAVVIVTVGFPPTVTNITPLPLVNASTGPPGVADIVNVVLVGAVFIKYTVPSVLGTALIAVPWNMTGCVSANPAVELQVITLLAMLVACVTANGAAIALLIILIALTVFPVNPY